MLGWFVGEVCGWLLLLLRWVLRLLLVRRLQRRRLRLRGVGMVAVRLVVVVGVQRL